MLLFISDLFVYSIYYLYNFRAIRICISHSKECILCHKCERNRNTYIKSNGRSYKKSTKIALKHVPQTIKSVLLKELIIIKSCHVICNPCCRILNADITSNGCILENNVQNLSLEIYSGTKHIIERSLMQKFVWHSLLLQDKQQEINELERNMQDLQNSDNFRSNKRTRIRYECKDKDKFDAEINLLRTQRKKLENKTAKQLRQEGYLKSNRWKNRINYDLISEFDCLMYTGFFKSTIVKQARICEWNPVLIFHARWFIYRYHPRRLQAIYFGLTHAQIITYIKKTLARMNERYALPRLINDRSINEQPYTWKKIHDMTPDWCYKLRELIKDHCLCPNIITADGTYQYCKTPQTDQDSRKLLFNNLP